MAANSKGQITRILSSGPALVFAPPPTPTRTDNRVMPKTYTIKKGDSLWSIAAKFFGNGSRYLEIVSLNSNLIRNPNLIQIGWVLRLRK